MTQSRNGESKFTRLHRKLTAEIRKVVGHRWEQFLALTPNAANRSITLTVKQPADKLKHLAQHVLERLDQAISRFVKRRDASYCTQSRVVKLA